MHFICLCPTFGRPSLVANALQLFLDQDLPPAHSSELVIFDDAGQIAAQESQISNLKSYRVISQPDWIPLPRKYNALLQLLQTPKSTLPNIVYVVWDDDDVYLPWHLKSIGRALHASPQAGWVHPSVVWSTYDERRPPLIPIYERPRQELARGRFHGALAVTGELLASVHGWPDTDLATYDQQMLGQLSPFCRADSCGCNQLDMTRPGGNAMQELAAEHQRAAPWTPIMPSYVYRWQDTGKWHCSGSIDQSGRYRRPPIQEPGSVDELIPRYDASTLQILSWFGPDRPLVH